MKKEKVSVDGKTIMRAEKWQGEGNGTIPVKSHQDCIIKKSKKFDFVHFWCGGTSRDEIYSHQFFLLSDPYFGFYSGSKFWHLGGTSILNHAISHHPMKAPP